MTRGGDGGGQLALSIPIDIFYKIFRIKYSLIDISRHDNYCLQGDALCPGTSAQCPSLPCGQNCLYDLTSSSADEIRGTHTTPVARYVDDISFKLSSAPGGGCSVAAKSRSQLWY